LVDPLGLYVIVSSPCQRVKLVETGATIQMTLPDQVLLSGVLERGAVASVHIKGGTVCVGMLGAPSVRVRGTPPSVRVRGTLSRGGAI
jgi:hypothetical protein